MLRASRLRQPLPYDAGWDCNACVSLSDGGQSGRWRPPDCDYTLTYARVYSKTARNFVQCDVATADLSTFLQILTSCCLFSDELTYKALEVIKVRNCYAHMPNFQIGAQRLNRLFGIIEYLEYLLIH